MEFYKSSSGGNDFLLLDEAELIAPPTAAFIQHLCDRHHGVGADGLVLYNPRLRPVSFRIFNRDGLEAELSGNGMAGLTALLYKRGHTDSDLVLATKSGEMRHHLLDRQEHMFHLQIDLGQPDFSNSHFFPFLSEHPWEKGYPYGDIRFFPVAIGNPQVVILQPLHLSIEDLMCLASELHKHPMFPFSTNISIIARHQADEAKIFFYERGVGPTLSSSTGLAGAYAVLRELSKGLVFFSFIPPNGEKTTAIGADQIYIENRTKIVFKGVYLLAVDE